MHDACVERQRRANLIAISHVLRDVQHPEY